MHVRGTLRKERDAAKVLPELDFSLIGGDGAAAQASRSDAEGAASDDEGSVSDDSDDAFGDVSMADVSEGAEECWDSDRASSDEENDEDFEDSDPDDNV